MVDWSGKIRALQVVLDNPSNIFYTGQQVAGEPSLEVKHHLTVLAELDLNLLPGAAQGGRSQDHKTLCCLCCK